MRMWCFCCKCMVCVLRYLSRAALSARVPGFMRSLLGALPSRERGPLDGTRAPEAVTTASGAPRLVQFTDVPAAAPVRQTVLLLPQRSDAAAPWAPYPMRPGGRAPLPLPGPASPLTVGVHR